MNIVTNYLNIIDQDKPVTIIKNVQFKIFSSLLSRSKMASDINNLMSGQKTGLLFIPIDSSFKSLDVAIKNGIERAPSKVIDDIIRKHIIIEIKNNIVFNLNGDEYILNKVNSTINGIPFIGNAIFSIGSLNIIPILNSLADDLDKIFKRFTKISGFNREEPIKEYKPRTIYMALLGKPKDNLISEYVKDQNFMKEKYLNDFFDISDIPENSDWATLYKERYRNAIKNLDLSPLTNTDKLLLMTHINFVPITDIDNLLNYTFSKNKTTDIIFKALTIYNNKQKLRGNVTLNDIIQYYQLQDRIEIATKIYDFYLRSGKPSNPVEYEHMLKNAMTNYVNNFDLSKIDRSNVPDYQPSNIQINNNPKKGILFCHGKKHRPPKIPHRLMSENIHWIMVDINMEYEPDIVASFKSWKDIQSLGLRQYDYIVTQYCPIAGGRYRIFFQFMRNVRWLLNRNGSLFIVPASAVHHNKKLSELIIQKAITLYGYSDYKRGDISYEIIV